MNSPTITMEKQAALKKLAEYEEAMRTNPKAKRELDRGILQGYRILAKGGRLVDVNEAIKAGGLNLAKLPRLAIARAHVEATSWGNSHGRILIYTWAPRSPFFDSRYFGNKYTWRLPTDLFGDASVSEKAVRAMCPLIPLPLRPRHDLSNYFLLWEANWHPEPPRDPYLLRPLAGSLMEIVAEWDLTPLEVAAMRNATISGG